jgi:hypothetical protein
LSYFLLLNCRKAMGIRRRRCRYWGFNRTGVGPPLIFRYYLDFCITTPNSRVTKALILIYFRAHAEKKDSYSYCIKLDTPLAFCYIENVGFTVLASPARSSRDGQLKDFVIYQPVSSPDYPHEHIDEQHRHDRYLPLSD